MSATIQVRVDDEFLIKLETSRQHVNEGKCKEAGSMVFEMRTKNCGG